MKTKRSLSGIFFRHQNPDTQKWENWCFEDLPPTEQLNIMDRNDKKYLKALVFLLAKTINELGETLEITKES